MGFVENFFSENLGEFKIKALSSHHKLVNELDMNR